MYVMRGEIPWLAMVGEYEQGFQVQIPASRSVSIPASARGGELRTTFTHSSSESVSLSFPGRQSPSTLLSSSAFVADDLKTPCNKLMVVGADDGRSTEATGVNAIYS